MTQSLATCRGRSSPWLSELPRGYVDNCTVTLTDLGPSSQLHIRGAMLLPALRLEIVLALPHYQAVKGISSVYCGINARSFFKRLQSTGLSRDWTFQNRL